METQINKISPGTKFRQLVTANNPLLITGVINACTALLAQQAQLQAIYLSGAGVANADFGLPDLGLTSLAEVVTQVSRITAAVDLPLLVDGDTGWGESLNIAYAVRQLIRAGAAGVHFEDQQWPKRCGHRDGKKLISADEMAVKIAAAVVARNESETGISSVTKQGKNIKLAGIHTESKQLSSNANKTYSPSFVIMARTDALAVEGEAAALERAKNYVAAGADMIFAEAVTELAQYKRFVEAVPGTPILANITEFGKTPLFTAEELSAVGVKLMLFPLSAFRAMNKAALDVFQIIQQHGTQKSCVTKMQTRAELYELLNYATMEMQIL